jgi:hypothetical protein
VTLGQLSPDQERFAANVIAGTGLDPTVVRSWIGAESGWGVTKPSHNYLNVGPGHAFASVDDAATTVSHLITSSPHYAGIRAAIPIGGGAQVEAITQSPWDAGHYGGDGRNLRRVFTQLVGSAGGATGGAIAATGTTASVIGDALRNTPIIGGLTPGRAPSAAGSVLRGVFGIDQVGDRILVAGLGLVFSLAALVLIAMGLARLTGTHPVSTFEKVATVAKVGAV